MFKRSSAYKKAICTVVLSVMLQSSFSGFINTVKAFDSPLTTTISTGNGPQSSTSPSSIKFPGTISPGEASASVNQNRFTLENRGLKINFSKDANGLYGMDYFKNKLTNENYNIKINKLFSIALNASTTISQGDMTIKSKPKLINLKKQSDSIRLSDRDSGKKVSTTFTYSKNGISFDLEWNVILRNNSNNMKQEFIIKCTSGTLDTNSIKLVDYTINTPGATPVKDGTDDGSPVTAKDIFVGLENPLSKINVSGNNAEISIPTAIPIKTNESRSFTTGIGVSPSGQIKRAFRYYLERERMHYRRPQLMYNTWWTFRSNDYANPPTEAQLNANINMYGENLSDRGVKVNFYQIDDGWDNVDGDPVWSFNHTSLPNEFKELKNTANGYGGNLGVWMSPFGGYSGKERRVAANIKNYHIIPYNNDPSYSDEYNMKNFGSFTLADENYFNRFREQTINMIKNQGVNAFKFDGVGVGLRNTGAPDRYLKEYESLLNLLSELRTVSPDVYIYCTVGTWASPYWLWYCDSVWRDEEDQGLSGESKYPGNKDSKGFDDRERWITYRDSAIRKHNAIENPFMTINELMTHGFTYSTYSNYVFNNDLTNADVKNSILNDMKMLFALGGSLEELHIQKDQMDRLNNDQKNFIWDNLAKNIKWAQSNFSLLSDNQWVGGEPDKGEVYGFASWSKDKAILSLRNPSTTQKTFTINPEKVFNIPSQQAKTYVFNERDNQYKQLVITHGSSQTITLKPFEVLIFESNSTVIRTSNSNSGNGRIHHNNPVSNINRSREQNRHETQFRGQSRTSSHSHASSGCSR